jgi:hypothetical protein
MLSLVKGAGLRDGIVHEEQSTHTSQTTQKTHLKM